MSTSKHLTIALTNSRPVRVSKKNWPLVAKGTEDTDHNNQPLFRCYYIRVRQHAIECPPDHGDSMGYYGGDKEGAPVVRPHRDGRCIVEAWYHTSWQGESGRRAGFMCHLEDVADKVREAGELIGAPEDVIDEALADLPPIEIEELPDWSAEDLEAELKARQSA